ncbi:MAG: ion channel [Acidobacteriota bacterium]
MDLVTNYSLTTAGLVLLALVFYDIYATILRGTKHSGLFSRFLNRGLWRGVAVLTQNLNRRLRHRILAAIGPLLMPLLISIFIVMLLTGFALIYMPRMETGFKINDAVGGSLIFKAFYFSGITLLTIGYGDILPITDTTRVVAIVEGASGIGIISLSITYLLTVYGALERKRAVALKFYHQARQGADISGFIASHFSRGRFYSLTESLREATRDLQESLESHLEHPIIHYFHSVEVYKGLPRALFVALETVAIINAHLDEKNYVEAGDHPDVLIAGDNARHVLFELLVSLNLKEHATDAFESEEKILARRRKCFNRAFRHLRSNGIKTSPDIEEAFIKYSKDRAAWEPQLYHFAEFLGYDWDEVTGDRSLQDATDDEVIERHEVLTVDNEVN